MSWSGLKKAVNRAGAHVIMKTSKNTESSTDPEFDIKEQEFKNYESLINEINSEFKNLYSTISDLTSTNLAISKTLDSFYGDYNFDLNSDNLLGLQSNNATINQRDGISLQYLKNSLNLHQDVEQSLDIPLQKTIFDPINQLIDYNNEIHKLIKKRNRKKFDYDVALNKLDKLQNEVNQLNFQLQNNNNNSNKNDNNIKSQSLKRHLEKLERAKSDLTSVAQIYNDLNNRLKFEIDEYIALRFSLLDPSFDSFMKIQQNFYSKCNSILNENIKVDHQSNEDFNAEKIDSKLDEILNKMKSLDINNL
ncbi:hypothetical protein CANINC_000458 [Pichia inconspicua]|uniref:BAR domain-containing protein n=1 Tax=Pichia inconspicua TaxID=52247 RepID=A0A4T0X610_9ASCO|nr:hypothetical protein CANINC_000458 [[Candida] inconspicua]